MMVTSVQNGTTFIMHDIKVCNYFEHNFVQAKLQNASHADNYGDNSIGSVGF